MIKIVSSLSKYGANNLPYYSSIVSLFWPTIIGITFALSPNTLQMYGMCIYKLCSFYYYFFSSFLNFPLLSSTLISMQFLNLHSVSIFRFPSGVYNQDKLEIEHPSMYFLCDGPNKNILEHFNFPQLFCCCKYLQAHPAVGPLQAYPAWGAIIALIFFHFFTTHSACCKYLSSYLFNASSKISFIGYFVFHTMSQHVQPA